MGLLKKIFFKDHNELLMTQPRMNWIPSLPFLDQIKQLTPNYWSLSFLLHSVGLMLSTWKVITGMRHPSSLVCSGEGGTEREENDHGGYGPHSLSSGNVKNSPLEITGKPE